MAPHESALAEAPEPPTPRGRPREFDQDEVLDSLLEVFWTQGFEATSIADLVEATGLNKSSLYNCFGSKEGLFAAAVERYIDMRSATLVSLADDGTQGLDGILALLDMQESQVAGDRGHMGCLVVNTATELGLKDEAFAEMARRFRSELRSAIATMFGKAEEMGEIGAGRSATYTEILVAFAMSLGVITRGGATADELAAQFSAMRDLVETWRL